jgi:hypothetical protein
MTCYNHSRLQDTHSFLFYKTTHDWLHPVGDHLSNIIGETNKRDIKKHLELLVADYPDIR